MLTVVAADLVAPDNRHLLQRRPKHKHHGGLWEYPGGKVEPGERLEDALCRELSEELGICVDPRDLRPLTFAHNRPSAGQQPVMLLLYRCYRWRGVPEALEGGRAQWFAPSQMRCLPMPPLDIELTSMILAGGTR